MSEAAVKIFKDAGALMEGHFLLTSGLHSPVYWEKFQVLQYPVYTEKLCKMIAEHYKNSNIEVVAGPTTGGVILAFEVARQLGVRGIFAEKEGGVRAFRRGFSIKPGERVLLVDDIMTTGGSIVETIDAINKFQGDIIGIGVLVDRSGGKTDFGIPLYSCVKVDIITYKPDACPLCTAGMQLVKPGSSKV